MPTEKQRRIAAQRKLARQLAARQERARKQRRQALAGGGIVAVVVVVILVLVFATGVFGGSGKKSTAAPTGSAASRAAPTPTTAPSATASAGPTASPFPTRTFPTSTAKPVTTSGPCRYAESAALLKSPQAKNVGLPPDPAKTPNTGTVPITMTTSQGPITITLNRADAPCAVQSFGYLASKKFFDDTSCPRLVTSGIFVLQCGDPSNSQSGGPTYEYGEEINSHTAYTTGTVAMANSNQASNPKGATTGSQFFIIYKDSPTLPKNYSVVGTVTSGMNVVEKIAKAGSNNKLGPGDGTPIAGLTIKTATLGKASA